MQVSLAKSLSGHSTTPQVEHMMSTDTKEQSSSIEKRIEAFFVKCILPTLVGCFSWYLNPITTVGFFTVGLIFNEQIGEIFKKKRSEIKARIQSSCYTEKHLALGLIFAGAVVVATGFLTFPHTVTLGLSACFALQLGSYFYDAVILQQ